MKAITPGAPRMLRGGSSTRSVTGRALLQSRQAGQRAREQGARDALHALLYQTTRVLEDEPPFAHGAALTAAELEIVELIRVQPSLSRDCVEILSRTFQDDHSAVLLKAARVLGAALSANDATVGYYARRLESLMTRLVALSSFYQVPPLPVDGEPDELLRGSSFEGQFRSVCAGGVDLFIDLSTNAVSTVEGGDEVGEWDAAAGVVRLAKDQEAQDAVRRSATALLGELKPKLGAGKQVVAASLQQAIASVGGGVVAAGAQAAATLPDELGLGRASRPRYDGDRAREQGARDALYAMLYQATSCTDGEVPHEPGAALTAAELEIVALVRAQPSLSADCVEFLAKLFQSDSSVVLLKAARVLGAALSADSSKPLLPQSAQTAKSIVGCIKRSPTLLPRMITLCGYTCAQPAEDTGGVDGSLKTVRAKGADYVVDMDSFIAFVGDEEVGTCTSRHRN